MFIKITMLVLILAIPGSRLLRAETIMPLEDRDPVGRLPEITVTAPRYAMQSEIHPGMLEEVTVTAQRPSVGIAGSRSQTLEHPASAYWTVPLTFLLVILSILYMSFPAHALVKEANHATTEH